MNHCASVYIVHIFRYICDCKLTPIVVLRVWQVHVLGECDSDAVFPNCLISFYICFMHIHIINVLPVVKSDICYLLYLSDLLEVIFIVLAC